MSSTGAIPRRPRVRRDGIASFACPDYHRGLIERPGRFRAQVLTVPACGRVPRMRVRVDPVALDMDLRQTVVRRDLSEIGGRTYLRRPGFLIADELERYELRDCSAVLLNGNNVGYWGNQFVIEDGELRAKRKGPLFDDDGKQLRAHATGDHAFFLNQDGRFTIADLALVVRDADSEASDVRFDVDSPAALPSSGLSGFPVLRRGEVVWREHAKFAWDPGLIVHELGPLSGVGYRIASIREYVEGVVTQDDPPLARHPMTVLGLDTNGSIVLLVAERRPEIGVFGMTVDEAARVMREQYGVVDAIVLGAAGDAQLATTREGFLVTPWVSAYSEAAARAVPKDRRHPALRSHPVHARPVPSYIAFEFDQEFPPPELPVTRWAGRPRHATGR